MKETVVSHQRENNDQLSRINERMIEYECENRIKIGWTGSLDNDGLAGSEIDRENKKRSFEEERFDCAEGGIRTLTFAWNTAP